MDTYDTFSVRIFRASWILLYTWLFICLLGFIPAHAKSIENMQDMRDTPAKLLPDPIKEPSTTPNGVQGVSSKDLQEDAVPSTQARTARWTFPANKLPTWQRIEDGLDIGLFPAVSSLGQACNIIILRVSPENFGFAVYATSATASPPLSLGDWAAQKNLVIATNASMYLPDGFTSTGYLRIYNHLNNKNIAKNFGAFFVAGPREKNLPEAQLLDRQSDEWETVLDKYDMVVQNYRMLSADRRLLWQPGGSLHAISALGRAADGSLLFIHCRDPILGIDFASLMLALPYKVGVLMYLEGGAQAGLMLRSPNMNAVWLGRDPVEFWTQNNSIAHLPNIIGVYRKKP